MQKYRLMLEKARKIKANLQDSVPFSTKQNCDIRKTYNIYMRSGGIQIFLFICRLSAMNARLESQLASSCMRIANQSLAFA